MSGSFNYVAGDVLGRAIAEQLGIDIMYVTKMVIEMNSDGPVYVHVTALAPGGAGEAFAEQITKYRLVADE